MENTLQNKIEALGKVIYDSEIMQTYRSAKLAYDTSDELSSAMAEYQTQRILLGEEYQKDNAMQDTEKIKTVEERIDVLYQLISGHPIYLDYVEAQKSMQGLMTEVNGEISYHVFGERPCTHDCSSCHADCSSKK